jgi:hypothetical protein
MPFKSNSLGLAMEFVVIDLVHDIKRNQDAAGHPDRKISNIDERVGGILPQVAHGDFEIIFKHGELQKGNRRYLRKI